MYVITAVLISKSMYDVRAFKVLKTNSYTSFHNALSSTLVSVYQSNVILKLVIECDFSMIMHVCVILQGYPREGIRVWPFERRSNGTMRPSVLEHIDDPKKTVSTCV